MTAPDKMLEIWRAVSIVGQEAFNQKYDEIEDNTAYVKASAYADQAAAIELSRRCVPIEEYQRVVGENVRLRESAAKIHNSVNIVGSAYHRAQTSLDEMVSEIKSELRAALKETGNAE